jgi:hypothetical protein
MAHGAVMATERRTQKLSLGTAARAAVAASTIKVLGFDAQLPAGAEARK